MSCTALRLNELSAISRRDKHFLVWDCYVLYIGMQVAIFCLPKRSLCYLPLGGLTSVLPKGLVGKRLFFVCRHIENVSYVD